MQRVLTPLVLKARHFIAECFIVSFIVTSIAVLISFEAHAQVGQPEGASGFNAKPLTKASKAMVATANPLASQAAINTLMKGGSAIDAAISAQMVLNLVEPQSSGIGGGAFLLYYDASLKKLSAYDGRETAPLGATERLFLDAQGKGLRFHEAVVGGRSVGAPGLLSMLEMAHAAHGKRTWAENFSESITLANTGFFLSARLHKLLSSDPFLKKDSQAAQLFYDSKGEALPIGTLVRNPALATTFAKITKQGSLALRQGEIASAIIDKVQNHPTNPGVLTRQDLIAYQAKQREPICNAYREYQVCGMPAPSSGGIAIAQILALYELKANALTLSQQGELNADAVHWFTQASKLAFADRNAYLADPDFVAPPQGLLSESYLKNRSTLIGPTMHSDQLANPGYPEVGTTHISIIDQWGNAVAMTSTIEDQFGSRQMVQGFLLNNQLTDFSFQPTADGMTIANRVQAGKRPRSSMSPTIVFDQHGRVRLIVGSPGGASIINYTAKTLIAHLRDGLDIQSAINLPNMGNRNGLTEIEANGTASKLHNALTSRGHQLRISDMTSGLQGIAIYYSADSTSPSIRELHGAADPRREGVALGY